MSDLTARKATICIVNYKTPRLTRLCLKSIRRFTTYPHEIIVVDNNSNDGFVQELGNPVLIAQPLHARGSQNNRVHITGIKLLDPRVEVSPEGNDVDIRPGVPELGNPPQTAGPDDTVG